MKTLLITTLTRLACACIVLAGAHVSAQAQSMNTNDAVYQGLGAKEGIDKIVDDFIPIVLADERINRFFAKLDKQQFAGLLSDQFCELAGGPCKYKGKDMYSAHDGMSISNAHFNALAEDLQMAMEKNHISSSIANQLVAKLAPMQRPIVSK